MQTLEDIMTRNVRTVSPDGTVQEAARLMKTLNVGSLPVVRDDRLVGVITDRDIAIRTVADGQDPKTARIDAAMSPEVHWAFEDAGLDEVEHIMEEKQVRRIPIVNREKRLVGIVALADLARSSAASQIKAESVRGVSR